MALAFNAHLLQSRYFLKITAVILGYTIWLCVSNDCIVEQTYQIPVAWYNIPATYVLDGPSTIRVKLRAKRSRLANVCHKTLALHMNAACLTTKENRINPHTGLLFLPETITVVEYEPIYLTIHVQEGLPTSL